MCIVRGTSSYLPTYQGYGVPEFYTPEARVSHAGLVTNEFAWASTCTMHASYRAEYVGRKGLTTTLQTRQDLKLSPTPVQVRSTNTMAQPNDLLHT